MFSGLVRGRSIRHRRWLFFLWRRSSLEGRSLHRSVVGVDWHRPLPAGLEEIGDRRRVEAGVRVLCDAGRFCTEAFRRGFFVYRGGANFEIRRERSYYALLRSIFAW